MSSLVIFEMDIMKKIPIQHKCELDIKSMAIELLVVIDVKVCKYRVYLWNPCSNWIVVDY